VSLFDVKFWLYRGANPDSDPSTWGVEEDASAKLRYPGNDGGAPIQYSGGKGDEAPGADSGQMTLTVDNRDATFSSLVLNTPARMGTVSLADDFARADTTTAGWGTVDATRGWSWAHTGGSTSWPRTSGKGQAIITAANTAIGARAVGAKSTDVDVTYTVTPLALATGARYSCGIQTRYTDSSNNLLIQLSFNTDGSTWLDINRISGGVTTQIGATANPTPGLTYTAGTEMKLRVQVDGKQIRAKAWKTADAEPAWMATATDTVLTGADVRVYAARYTSNTNSSSAALMSFDDFQAVGLEFCGSLVSVPLRWNKTKNNSWAPLTFAGIIRRMTQGSYPVDSPLSGLLGGRTDKTGYWTLEGGVASRTFISYIANQYAATFNQVSPAANSDLLGGGPAPTLNSDTAQIFVTTTKNNGGTGFSALWFMKLPSGLPATKTRVARIRCSRGPIPIWDVYVDTGGYYVEGKQPDGTITTSQFNTPAATFDYTQWIAWEMRTEVNGANTDWKLTHWQIGNGITFYYTNGSTPGTTVSVVRSGQFVGSTGTAFAHLWLGQNTLPFVTYSFINGATGFDGEYLIDRWIRVLAQFGIPQSYRLPVSYDKMGPQQDSDLLAILKTITETNYAAISERGSGLELITRESRWNLTERFTLDVGSFQLDEPPEGVRDDLKYRNVYTVSRAQGGQATYTHPDVEDGTVPSVAGSATINSEIDAVLINQAAWRVYLAMNTKYRWPAISMNFGRNYTLSQSWRTRGGYGARVKVITGLDQVVDGEPDLVMEGFSSTLWPDGWQVSLNCSPYEVWKVGVADDTTGLGQVGHEGCFTTALVSSTALSIPITSIGDKPWNTTGSIWSGGVGMKLDDEQATVTAIATALADAFGRTSGSSFGSADAGGAYTLSGGAAGNFNVSTGLGRITNASVNVLRFAYLAGQTVSDVDMYWTTAVSAVATGASLIPFALARMADTSNYFRFEITFTTAGTVDLRIRKVVAGTGTSIAFVAGVLPYAAGTLIRCRAQAYGSLLRVKAWLATDQEPLGWHLSVTDAALSAAGFVGVGSVANTGNTNVSPESRFDDLAVNQTLTLSARGVGDTVAASHPAGTQVQLWNAAIAAL
jgi:hypothetical protein